ncbi:hypothetical protein CsSME_00046233 [Camellia sinensis var. sinensis]
MGSSVAPPLLVFSLAFLFSILSCSSDDPTFEGIDLENPVIDVTPSPLTGYTSSSHGSKDVLLCERVRVVGQSRLKLGSYASAYQVKLVPSAVIPERLHNKIQICFHQNASRGLCQCETEWKTVHKELWSPVMSPYEDRYVDVKFVDKIAGYVTVTVDKEFQRWRLFCLAFGFVLLLLAPVVSSWVPFYCSSSMAVGVFLVIIILLFQVFGFDVHCIVVFFLKKNNLLPFILLCILIWCYLFFTSFQFLSHNKNQSCWPV